MLGRSSQGASLSRTTSLNGSVGFVPGGPDLAAMCARQGSMSTSHKMLMAAASEIAPSGAVSAHSGGGEDARAATAGSPPRAALVSDGLHAALHMSLGGRLRPSTTSGGVEVSLAVGGGGGGGALHAAHGGGGGGFAVDSMHLSFTAGSASSFALARRTSLLGTADLTATQRLVRLTLRPRTPSDADSVLAS